MADVVRPQVRTRSRRARRVVNFSQIPQLDHVRRDLNAGAYVGQKGKREKRLPITLLIETAISNVGECVRLEYRRTQRKKRGEKEGGREKKNGGREARRTKGWKDRNERRESARKRERKRDKSRREQ